jgi:glycosyltransferase involved in cell wall biosynthesis
LRQVDVVLLTKNSEHLLEKCLKSIYANLPVKNLIVVDGYSTDRTCQIVKDFHAKHGNVLLLKTNGSRARAREEGIRRVTTDFFAFIDSDVVLCKDWLGKAQKGMVDGVGAVWGLNIDIIPNIKDKRLLYLESLIARISFNLRGGMHDTLIRTSTVEDIHIPEALHAYEDAYIIRYIKKQGFKVHVSSELYCLHYKPPTNWSAQNAIDQAVVELKCGLIRSHMFAYMLLYPVFMFYWVLQVPFSGFGGLLTRQRTP